MKLIVAITLGALVAPVALGVTLGVSPASADARTMICTEKCLVEKGDDWRPECSQECLRDHEAYD